MVINDIKNDDELLADLRNKLTPIVNLIALIELGLDYDDKFIRKGVKESKEIIELLTNKKYE